MKKFLFYLGLTFLLLFPPLVQAQFWEDTPAELSGDIEDLQVLEDGRVVAAVDGEGIFTSDDGGVTFSHVVDESSLSELAEGEGRLVAIGLDGVFVSDDDAVSWNQLLPVDAWSVAMGDGTVAVGGSASILFASFNAGSTWNVPNVEHLPFLRSTSVPVVAADGDVIAYKTIFSNLRVSTDGGESWSDITSINPDVIVHIDGTFYADRFDEIWTSTDLVGWGQIGSKSDVFWEDIDRVGDAIVVAGAFDGLALSTNGGQTWENLTDALGTDRVPSVAFLPDGRLLAGTDCCIYRSSDPVEEVSGINADPQASSIAPINLREGGSEYPLDLNSTFTDPDGDPLTYTATSSDQDIVTVSVSESTLTLYPAGAGSAIVSVTADDGHGGQAMLNIDVTVSINTSPTISSAIPDQEVSVDSPELTFSLLEVFTDPDDDTLTLSAASSDEEVASVSVSEAILSVVPLSVGTATISVTATDPFSASVTDEFLFTVSGNTTAEQAAEVPYELSLEPVYPNPVRENAAFRIILPEAGRVVVEAFSVDGRRVALLINAKMPPGTHEVNWQLSDLSSGTYLVRLISDQKVSTKTVTVVR